MIDPKEVEIDGKVYVLTKFPAVAGREIVAKYPLSAIPKLGDYAVNEETMLKLMCYVGVPREGKEPLMLTTRALVDNHVPSWETLAKIEMAMLERSCSFFANGRGSTFFEAIAQKAQAFLTQTLTASLAQSSQKK